MAKTNTLALLVLLWVAAVVTAFPDHAGTCNGGLAIKKDSKKAHGRRGEGVLEDRGLELRLNDAILRSNAPTVIPAGTKVVLSIAGSGQGGSSHFRGFLARLSDPKGRVNCTDSLNPASAEDLNLRKLASTGAVIGDEETLPTCAEGVAGVSHANNEVKTLVEMDLLHPDDADLKLEITVVVTNDGGGLDNWYYSSYDLKFRADPQCSKTSVTSVTSLCDFSIDDLSGVSAIAKEGESYYILSDDPANPTMYTVNIRVKKNGDCSGKVVSSCTFELEDGGPLAGLGVSRDGNFFVLSQGDSDAGVAPFIGEFDGSCSEVGDRFSLPIAFTGDGNGLDPTITAKLKALAVEPTFASLFTATENGISNIFDEDADPAVAARLARVVELNGLLDLFPRAEFVYATDETAEGFGEPALTGILSLDESGTLLTMETSSGGPDGPYKVVLYEASAFASANVNGTSVLQDFPIARAATKTKLVDLEVDLSTTPKGYRGLSVVQLGPKGGSVVLAANSGDFVILEFKTKEGSSAGVLGRGLLANAIQHGLPSGVVKDAQKLAKFANKKKIKANKIIPLAGDIYGEVFGGSCPSGVEEAVCDYMSQLAATIIRCLR